MISEQISVWAKWFKIITHEPNRIMQVMGVYANFYKVWTYCFRRLLIFQELQSNTIEQILKFEWF